MVFKTMYVHVVVRVLIIVGTSLLLSKAVSSSGYLHTAIVLSVLLLLETLELLRYLNRTNRQLSRFFASLLDRGSSIHLDKRETSGSYRELTKQLDAVNRIIQTERMEKEKEKNYLNYLIEHIGVGVITYKESGDIDLINPAAKKIFREKKIPNLAYLNTFNPEFKETIEKLEVNRHTLLSIIVENELFYLTVRKSLFKIYDQPISLINFQDINSELDKKELESWQKIIRVLTHEIMSTISPVTSLSEHLLKKIDETEALKDLKKLERKHLEDITEGLEIIHTRGKGLMDFVQHYHSMTHLPIPEPEEFHVKTFLEGIVNLFRPECEKKRIAIKLDLQEGLVLCADNNLIQQVLINMVKNSIHALAETTDKKIWITGRSDGSQILISVKDNGCGIDKENMENIFIPFYTTRKEGSGIGLSLAKQIMRLHNGQISVKSEPGQGAGFVLKF